MAKSKDAGATAKKAAAKKEPDPKAKKPKSEAEQIAIRVGERTIEMVRVSGQKQSQIERGTGINKSTVHKWLNGERYPHMGQVILVARYLKVRCSYLVEGEPPVFLSDSRREHRLTSLGRELGLQESVTVLELADKIGIKVATDLLQTIHDLSSGLAEVAIKEHLQKKEEGKTAIKKPGAAFGASAEKED